MRKYISWQAPFYSFWSKSFYVDVAKHWSGCGYGYLFLLICFTSLFLSINITMDLADSEYVNDSEHVTKSEYVTKNGKHVTKIERVTKSGGEHWSIDVGSKNKDNPTKPSKRHYAIRFSWIDLIYPTDHHVGSIVEQIPRKMTIEKGILSIKGPPLYTLRDTSDQPIITFDTRENPMPLNEATSFILTRDSIIVKRPIQFDLNFNNILKLHYSIDGPLKKALPNIDHGSFKLDIDNSAPVDHWFADFKRSIVLTAYAILVPCGFVFCVIQSLIYGLIGIVIAKVSKIQMSYGTLVRLSTVALTPVLLIEPLLKVYSLNTESWGLLAFVITVGYLIFAIQANIALSEHTLAPAKSPTLISSTGQSQGQPSSMRKLLSAISHGSGLLSSAVLWIFVPLLILVGSDDTVVKENAKEAINFHLNVIVLIVPLIILCFFIIGIPLLIALIFATFVLPIIAVVRVCVDKDKPYHYPWVIHFIRPTTISPSIDKPSL